MLLIFLLYKCMYVLRRMHEREPNGALLLFTYATPTIHPRNGELLENDRRENRHSKRAGKRNRNTRRRTQTRPNIQIKIQR